MITDIKAAKKEQRREVLARRDAISAAQRAEKSRRLCENIINSPFYAEAETIMLFRAFRSEAELTYLAERAQKDGKRVAYPRCIEDRRMLALIPSTEDAWETDSYGISVPEMSCERAAEEEIDLVVCPCSGFDEGFHRLGMGAGYYDRFLPQCRRAKKVLAAFEEQCLTEVATDEHDVIMDAVITDEKIRIRR